LNDSNVTAFPVKPKGKLDKALTLVIGFEGCQHPRAIVDASLNELECADCHQKLNPIKFLARMATQSTLWDYEAMAIKKLRAELAERKRCRCLHCGQWTEIRSVSHRELERIRRRNGKL
jgi:hypothetical protein